MSNIYGNGFQITAFAPLLQVALEAAKVDTKLKVSWSLILSSPELQEKYYDWMGQRPVVRWFMRLILGGQLAMYLKMLLKAEDGCGWRHVGVHLPFTALTMASMALEKTGAPKRLQSLVSLIGQIYIFALYLEMQASNDLCLISLGPNSMPLKTTALFAAVSATVILSQAPCTMQHYDVLCAIVAVFNTVGMYLQYLIHNGGLSFSSDPDGSGFVAIVLSTIAAILTVCTVRYCLVGSQMKQFLRNF